MKSRVHPRYKAKCRVGNWPEYERALVQRGDITLWLSADATDAWTPSPSGRRGAQRKFSDLAIETALTLRLVFGLPLRQAEGFLRSDLSLMRVDLEAPDHTTLSRRSQHLGVTFHLAPANEPIHLIVDSSGLSIAGEGEWAVVKHEVLSTPATAEYVALRGTACGLLYATEPPDFEPVYYRPLTFTAIGSGRGVMSDLERVHDWIVAGDVGNPHVEALSCRRDGGRRYGTGGGSSRRIPAGAPPIELAYEENGWVQRNRGTDRELRLVPPWKVAEFQDAGILDDIDKAYRSFGGPQQQ